MQGVIQGVPVLAETNALFFIWNIVEINGKYYNVDVSMGYDCFSDLFDDSRKFDKYRCFAVPDDQLSEFHRIYHLPWPSLPCSHSLEDRVK